ncbi:site-specific integrase [Asticcacaulis sp. DXS10W]|uniref:Site-specific integrase n=1 Tax=Asticcacaulis currens TaxID=2984210 RepID=A0ABT5IDM9_9CAUL|nr:site-specific integrase [Asticcacaulis currens]MDC7694278.1 site-specific integrase [Asticcacaulis currens]
MPRFWATVYCDVFKAARKPATLRRILSAIDRLCRFGEGMVPVHDIDQILTRLDIQALKNLMVGFLSHLRTTAQGHSVSADQTWRAAFDFVYDMLKILGVSSLEATRLHSELRELKNLYGQLSPAAPSRPRHITAVPASVISELYDILSLEGHRNPFRSVPEKKRNLLIFEILLRTGLRRGELLALGVDALQWEFDTQLGRTRFWLNVAQDHAEEDPRYLKGSLKTATSWRSIPVPVDLAHRIQHFVDYHRGQPNHPFLFTSNQRLPLSAPAVSLVLETVSRALSPEARTSLQIRGMSGVRPHDLRHTSVVARLQMFKNAGVPLDESIERLRPYYGWSPGSKMPFRYGRAYFETQFTEVWEEVFEDHLAALREIMGGDQ